MYPPTRRTGASSSYRSQSQGTVVVDDPYRWLEQDSTERRAWAHGLFLTYQKLISVLILLSSRSIFDDVSPPIFSMGNISHSCQKMSRICPGSTNVMHVPHHDWLWCLLSSSTLRFEPTITGGIGRPALVPKSSLYCIDPSLRAFRMSEKMVLKTLNQHLSWSLTYEEVYIQSLLTWAHRVDRRIHSNVMEANHCLTGLCHRTKNCLPLSSLLSLVLIVSRVLGNRLNASFPGLGHKWHISAFQRWEWAKHRRQTDRFHQ